MSFDDLRHIESLARVAGHLDEEPRVSAPGTWGPASWWRLGLVVFAALIAATAIWHTVS